jgi:hypothetical protein
MDLAANRLDEAGQEAREALQLDPGSRAAQDLSRKIASKTAKKQ